LAGEELKWESTNEEKASRVELRETSALNRRLSLFGARASHHWASLAPSLVGDQRCYYDDGTGIAGRDAQAGTAAAATGEARGLETIIVHGRRSGAKICKTLPISVTRDQQPKR